MSKLIRAAIEELQQSQPYVLGEEAALGSDQIELIDRITDLSYGNQEFELVTEAYTDLMRFEKVMARTGGQLTTEQGKFVSLMMHHVLAPLDVHTGKAQQQALEAMEGMSDAGRYESAMESIGEWLGKLWDGIVNFVKKCVEWIGGIFGFNKKSKVTITVTQQEVQEVEKGIDEVQRAAPADRPAKAAAVSKKLPKSTAKVDDTPLRSNFTFTPSAKKAMVDQNKDAIVAKSGKAVKADHGGDIPPGSKVTLSPSKLYVIAAGADSKGVVQHSDVVAGLKAWVVFLKEVTAFHNEAIAQHTVLLNGAWDGLVKANKGTGGSGDRLREFASEWNKLAVRAYGQLGEASGKRAVDGAVNGAYMYSNDAELGREMGYTVSPFKFKTSFNAASGHKDCKVEMTFLEWMDSKSWTAEINKLAMEVYHLSTAMVDLQGDKVRSLLLTISDSSKETLLKSLKDQDVRNMAKGSVLPIMGEIIKGLSGSVLGTNMKIHHGALAAYAAANAYVKEMQTLRLGGKDGFRLG